MAKILLYLRNVPVAVNSSGLVAQLKLMKPTHDDIIEANEVYSQRY